jgi:flagellar basal body rod protein FlgF
VTVTDNEGNTDSSTGFGVDVLTLRALRVYGEIDYGTLNVGSSTEGYNATSSVRNTGNDMINVDVSGTDLVSAGGTIPVDNQKFATSSFVYSSCTICSLLSGTSTTYSINLDKTTSTSTPSADLFYWGLNVPTGSAGLDYIGTNEFFAVPGS